MANRILSKVNYFNISAIYNLTNVANTALNVTASQKIRKLYAKSTLGIEGFLAQCELTHRQMENIADNFILKMQEYATTEKNMIFTEDLKNMIHLSKTDKDAQLVVEMIKKFNQQNKQLRFGNFIFGPVVMRLFHHLNKPDLALESFRAPELVGFFDQLMSYQILFDLLYENQMYSEMFECFDDIQSRQIQDAKYPRNIIVLVLAACYKLNSKESLDYALKLWDQLKSVGHFPMRRATTFCAGLAFNQGHPGTALEILTSAKNQSYTTVRNLKVAALAELGRVENIIPILKSILATDIPNSTQHTFLKEVIDRVKEALAKVDNPELILEFNRLEEQLQKQGQIINDSIDHQLCREIQKPALMSNREGARLPRNGRPPSDRRPRRYDTYQQRPGLNELV